MTAKRIFYEKEAYYHITNRVCGASHYFPIDDVAKQKFLDLMRHLLQLHSAHIKIISYAIMDNHYHLVIAHDSSVELTRQEVQYRFFDYYKSERTKKEWHDHLYERVLKRMRSLSAFMRELDRRLSLWFNQTYHRQLYGEKRRGHFWQDKYKSCIIDSPIGLRRCIAYVECNPLRAGLVDNPGEYHFSSFGVYKQSGKHPFVENFARHYFFDRYSEKVVLPKSEKKKFKEAITSLEDIFFRRLTLEKNMSEIQALKTMAETPFDILTKRIKYWKDSRIIFCKLKGSKVEENIYEKKLDARKTIHKFKDASDRVFKLFNWHKLFPE